MDHSSEIIRLIAAISGKDPADVDRGMELVANLGFDSAKALELLVKLEDLLGIEIEEEQAATLNTVGDILDFVARRAAARS